MWWKFVVPVIFLFGFIECLDNGLARTPPMGWMTWQRFRCVTDCKAYPKDCVSDDLIRSMADLMHDEGYVEAGYNYIVIDDCWSSKERDDKKRLVPDPERFPHGMKALADYVHSKSIRFGIYGDMGTKTCAGYPGSIDHLKLDAQTWADWGVDYLKMDGCHPKGKLLVEDYAKLGKYLNQTGRPIVFSCSWPAYEEPLGIQSNYTAAVEICNLWRNYDDIEDSYANLTHIIDWYKENQDRLAPYHGPGHWNDPDMLLTGNFGLSYEQSKAQMIIWAIMGAPLLMSVDLRTIEPKFKDLLQNKHILAINQDEFGIQGKIIATIKKVDIWVKPIAPEIEGKKSFAIGLVSNRVDGYPYLVNFTLADLKMDNHISYSITNILEDEVIKHVQSNDTLNYRVKPTGGVLLKAIPIIS